MIKEELIKLIEKEVPDGCDIGIALNIDTIAVDLGITYVKATMKKRGRRNVADKAKTGLFVVGEEKHLPQNFRNKK